MSLFHKKKLLKPNWQCLCKMNHLKFVTHDLDAIEIFSTRYFKIGIYLKFSTARSRTEITFLFRGTKSSTIEISNMWLFKLITIKNSFHQLH